MPVSLDPQPGENEFECARCGTLVHDSLTRCPNCGVNLYEPDDDEPEPPRPVYPSRVHTSGLWGWIGDAWRRMLGKPNPADALFTEALQQAELFNDLLTKAGGDRSAAERLVDFERQRQPGAGRSAWLQNAIRRWEQDNQ